MRGLGRGCLASWSDVGVTWTAGAGVGCASQKRQRPGEPEKQAGACGRSAGNGSNRRQADCKPSRAVVVCVRCLGSCYCATGQNGDCVCSPVQPPRWTTPAPAAPNVVRVHHCCLMCLRADTASPATGPVTCVLRVGSAVGGLHCVGLLNPGSKPWACRSLRR